VYLAESLLEPGGLAAVKVIDKAELCRDGDKMFLVDREIEIMSQLDHPNIVRLYEVYENEAEVCLVMELAKGGELFDRLVEVGSLEEREAGRVMAQVLEAVSDLHSRGIVHRDLKPENLLFYDNRAGSPLLMADFGLSEYEDCLSAKSPVCGTATYLAPEVIAQICSSRAQDLWSCGVICYILLCGYPPFCREPDDDEEDSLLRQIVIGRYEFHPQFWDSVSEEAQDFVRRLLVTEPGLRMSVDEALLHPWIRAMAGQEAGLRLGRVLLHTFLAILLLLAIIFLHMVLLTDYFDLDQHVLSDRVAEFWAELSHRNTELSVIVKSFFDLRPTA
jgi:calcium/calmodulin-dependent protein kinase I